jgi:hypothetical protein
MKTYTVYRVDYQTNKTEAIGTLVERRRGPRHNNAADLLRLAQKLYATSSIDSHIFISPHRLSWRGDYPVTGPTKGRHLR